MLWTFRRPGGGIPTDYTVPVAATHYRYWIDPNGYYDAVEYTDTPTEYSQTRRYGEGGPGKWRKIE